jgi:TorA maturation chaperone TorD
MEELIASDLAYHAFVRSRMYELLAKSFLYPTDLIFRYIRSDEYGECLFRYGSLHETDGTPRMQELISSSRSEVLKREDMESEYNRLFAHLGSAKCPPYESEYGFDNIFQKTHAMADIAGFYRAYGLEVADTDTERVDFIATELEFMSYLLMSETYARANGIRQQVDVAIDTQKKFLRDHLGRWMGVFSTILIDSTKNPFYHSLGNAVQEFVEREITLLGVTPERVSVPKKPDVEPLEPFGCQDCMAQDHVAQKNNRIEV